MPQLLTSSLFTSKFDGMSVKPLVGMAVSTGGGAGLGAGAGAGTGAGGGGAGGTSAARMALYVARTRLKAADVSFAPDV